MNTLSPTVWAAYLCLLLLIVSWIMLFSNPLSVYLARYNTRGRHRPQPVVPHVHQAYTVLDGYAYCSCGEVKRLADGNYPERMA